MRDEETARQERLEITRALIRLPSEIHAVVDIVLEEEDPRPRLRQLLDCSDYAVDHVLTYLWVLRPQTQVSLRRQVIELEEEVL